MYDFLVLLSILIFDRNRVYLFIYFNRAYLQFRDGAAFVVMEEHGEITETS